MIRGLSTRGLGSSYKLFFKISPFLITSSMFLIHFVDDFSCSFVHRKNAVHHSYCTSEGELRYYRVPGCVCASLTWVSTLACHCRSASPSRSGMWTLRRFVLFLFFLKNMCFSLCSYLSNGWRNAFFFAFLNTFLVFLFIRRPESHLRRRREKKRRVSCCTLLMLYCFAVFVEIVRQTNFERFFFQFFFLLFFFSFVFLDSTSCRRVLRSNEIFKKIQKDWLTTPSSIIIPPLSPLICSTRFFIFVY